MTKIKTITVENCIETARQMKKALPKMQDEVIALNVIRVFCQQNGCPLEDDSKDVLKIIIKFLDEKFKQAKP